MAIKTFYATKDMRHPTYRTRMLRAGDPVELDGPNGRLFTAIGAVSEEAPRTLARPDADGSGNVVRSTRAAPARKPAAKRKTKAKK